MRGAYGKPYGKVARVDIGEPLMSVRVKDSSKANVIEALRRSKFKVSIPAHSSLLSHHTAVPWPSDHRRVQEVGLHQVEPRGLREGHC
jgi:hypothetical protein